MTIENLTDQIKAITPQVTSLQPVQNQAQKDALTASAIALTQAIGTYVRR
jgi:hypothetical protein